MARFLFVVPPLTGHVNPTVSVAAELVARGHDVAWVGHPTRVLPLLPDGARLFELDDRISPELYDEVKTRIRKSHGLAAFKLLFEEFFIPLARAMRPGVEDAADRFGPDVLVVDQQALAGGVVARSRDLPWATFATTSAAVTDPLASLPRVREWYEGQLRLLQDEAGLDPIPEPDRSPMLTVVFSSAALVGGVERFPDHYVFVGPSISDRPETTPFPWTRLREDVPRVLVSLGTVNADRGERFYRLVVDAVRGEPLQVVMVAPEALVPDPPENVIVRSYVPQLSLLKRMDAVVSHAGHNTVCETLANGLPLVMTPITDDQPVVAQQVADAGAGIRLRFNRLRMTDLREAVLAVLQDPSYREAAVRIARSFASAGGAGLAADRLVKLSRERGGMAA